MKHVAGHIKLVIGYVKMVPDYDKILNFLKTARKC
jgi:hypothetical protein